MKDIVVDAYFHIGEQHIRGGLPCEDYALAHRADHLAYLVVSDGCSSGGKTDVGARLLAHGFAQAVLAEAWRFREGEAHVYLEHVRVRAELTLRGGMELLGLAPRDMLATSMLAVWAPEGVVMQIYGDGVVARRYRSGELHMSSFSWEGNTPFYPAYHLETPQSFIRAHGNDLAAPRLKEERVIVHRDVCERETVMHSLQDGMAGIPIVMSEKEAKDLIQVALFSDGVTQVEGVPWERVVQDFLAFRSPAGAFVKRRIMRQLQHYAREGAAVHDDVSGAALVRRHTREEEEP